jgi:hypothetical protein
LVRVVQAWIWRSGQRGGFDDMAVRQQVIALGMFMIDDLTGHADRDAIRALVKKAFPDAPAVRIQTVAAQLYSFRHAVAVGDLVLMVSNRVSKVAIGEVTGGYRFHPGPGERLHLRDVRWLRQAVDRVAVGPDLLRAPASSALYRVRVDDAVARLRAVAGGGPDPVGRSQRHVPAPRPAIDPLALAAVEAATAGLGDDLADVDPVRPLDRLQDNLDHARNLARAGEMLQSAGTELLVDIADVYRAAWVQACTAFEHWVRQEVTVRAFALARSPTQPKRLASVLPTGSLDDADIRQAIARFHNRQTYLRPEPIRQAFALATDLDDLWQPVATYLRQDGVDSGYDALTVPDAIVQISLRRNQITHLYDEDPTSPDGKRPLTDMEVLAMIDWLERLAMAVTAALPEDGEA